jgi:hypothetical protein
MHMLVSSRKSCMITRENSECPRSFPRHDGNTFVVRLDSPSPNTPQLAAGSFIPDDYAMRHSARSAASISQNLYRPRSLQAAA